MRLRRPKHLSGLEYAVHDDRKLSGNRHRSALEAQPLRQLEAPDSETALVPGTGSREDHRRHFIKHCPPYAAELYRETLAANGLIGSMGRRGNPYCKEQTSRCTLLDWLSVN